ncbi:MAG TPA: Ig-like domain-containing protein [Pantanalinema sp.]
MGPQFRSLVFLLVLFWSLSSVTGCAPGDEEGPPVVGVPQATPTPSGEVGGAIGTGDGGTSPTPAPAPAITLWLKVTTDSLFVPPVDGGTPLYPSAFLFVAEASSPSLPITWQSSDTRLATVDPEGRVRAVRPGTVVITARCQDARATASVTVAEKARLSISTQGAPGQTSRVELSVRDDQGQLVASQATSDLTRLGNLTVEAIARDAGGRALAAGRAEGVSLFPNQLRSLAIPLNVPHLDAVASAGPRAVATLTGSGFSQWIKLQGGQQLSYAPSVSADFDGVPATLTVVSDAAARVTVPATLAGASARPFTLSVGGCPVSSTFRLVGAIRIDPFPDTMANLSKRRYTAIAYDTAGQPLSDAELAWEASDKGGGTMTTDGNFMATTPGTSFITVRSGAVTATTSVTVQ